MGARPGGTCGPLWGAGLPRLFTALTAALGRGGTAAVSSQSIVACPGRVAGGRLVTRYSPVAPAGGVHHLLGYSLQERRGVLTGESRRGAGGTDRAGEGHGSAGGLCQHAWLSRLPLPPSPVQGVLPRTRFSNVNQNPLPGDPRPACGHGPCPAPSR